MTEAEKMLSRPQNAAALKATKPKAKRLRLTVALLAAGQGARFSQQHEAREKGETKEAAQKNGMQKAEKHAVHKLCAPLAGRPVVDWALEACEHFSLLANSQCGSGLEVETARVAVIPATSAEREQLYDMVVRRGTVPLLNPDAHLGMAHSLKQAAEYAASMGAHGLLIMLADMPFVSAALMAEVAGGWVACAQPQDAIVRPVGHAGMSQSGYAGQAGHPVLFGAAHFGALSKLSGGEGAAAFIKAFAAQGGTVTCIATQHMGAFFDIDTADDLARAEALASAAGLQASRAGHEGFEATTGPTSITGPTPVSGGQHSPY